MNRLEPVTLAKRDTTDVLHASKFAAVRVITPDPNGEREGHRLQVFVQGKWFNVKQSDYESAKAAEQAKAHLVSSL